MPRASPPLIVTLALDTESFALFDSLRQAHFPPERNLLPAHVTLFHALPGEEAEAVRDTLAEVCAAIAPLPLVFPKVRSLGKGVAVEVDSPELLAVRKKLAAGWEAWLTPQDRQPYRPHVTVQNKVTPDEAKRLFAHLSAAWTPRTGTGLGLLLWRYVGGPWEPAGEFPFGG